jgi:DNA repair protein RadA/Sms
VLDARAGIGISAQDVYLNVAGGLRIGEPAADLAAAGALVSSHLGVVVPPDCVFFGEISLSGTIRNVGQADARLKEAQKLGFKRAFVPPGIAAPKGLELTPVPSVAALVALLKTVL